MKRAAIIYKFLPQYRVEFFNKLKRELEKHEIELILIYGKLKNEHKTKGDEVEIEWAKFVRNRTFSFFGMEFYWQPVLKYTKNVDLVIVEQANKLLINYLLQLRSIFTKTKFAFWGHGINHQAGKYSLGNIFKRLITNRADWWFAYTETVANNLSDNYFPKSKITVVENAIDTISLIRHYQSISEKEENDFRAKHRLNSDKIGIYCGGIYKEKRMDFLFAALKIIKSKIPNFQFFVLGNGPDVEKIKNFQQELNTDEKWIYYEGAKFGKEKVIYFKIASLLLIPGLVGLAILDSFALRTPLVTTDYPFHSPEIEYLNSGINGVMTKNDLNSFANEVIRLMHDNSKIELLVNGCEKSANYYTVERMVRNFAEGIRNAL